MLFRFTILLHLLICCSATAALWTSGHGDISLRYLSAPQPALSFQWTVGTGGDSATVDGADVYDAVYAPISLTPVVSSLRIASPDAILTGGSLIHLVPQDGTDASLIGSPFQGWNTGTIPGGLFSGNQIRLQLTGVNGPGAVSLWSNDAFGGSHFRWTSANGFTPDDTLTLGIGGHSHYNLGFTLPGDYSLQVLAQATFAAGGSVATPMTLQYSVVPESSASFLLLGLAAVFSQLRRRA
jgi:surface-anchored protein